MAVESPTESSSAPPLQKRDSRACCSSSFRSCARTRAMRSARWYSTAPLICIQPNPLVCFWSGGAENMLSHPAQPPRPSSATDCAPQGAHRRVCFRGGQNDGPGPSLACHAKHFGCPSLLRDCPWPAQLPRNATSVFSGPRSRVTVLHACALVHSHTLFCACSAATLSRTPRHAHLRADSAPRLPRPAGGNSQADGYLS